MLKTLNIVYIKRKILNEKIKNEKNDPCQGLRKMKICIARYVRTYLEHISSLLPLSNNLSMNGQLKFVFINKSPKAHRYKH